MVHTMEPVELVEEKLTPMIPTEGRDGDQEFEMLMIDG